MTSHSPPTYLVDIVTAVEYDTLIQIRKRYGENVTAFKFRNDFVNIIYSWYNEYDCPAGNVWLVDREVNKITIFDQFLHGYNGVMKLNQANNITSTKTDNLTIGTCVVIAFQYSGDEKEFVTSGPSKKESDYFDWIIIYKDIDSQLEEILNYECA